MFRCPSRIVVVALFSLNACTSGGSEWFRKPEARQDTTIFSALDLPTPGTARTASGVPGPDYWQQQADYVIEASLDPETRVLRGREHVTWHNNSPEALSYLWVNLEQNAFRKDSLGVAIAPYTAIGVERAEGDGCTIHALRSGGVDLAHAVYDTEMRVEAASSLLNGCRAVTGPQLTINATPRR